MITGVLRFPHSHSLPGLLLLGSVNRNQLTCSFVPGFPQHLSRRWNVWVHFSHQACELKPSRVSLPGSKKEWRAASFYFIIILHKNIVETLFKLQLPRPSVRDGFMKSGVGLRTFKSASYKWF